MDNLSNMHLLERQEQFELLNRCLQEARAGAGKLVLIAGEAGLGKSSLVERFTLEHRRDAYTLWGACDSLATPRALAPVYEIAAQMSALDGRPAAEDQARDLLFRSLFEGFARPEPACVVVLEDLHWADEATLDFLRFIGRRIQRTSVLFIATYRDDEFSANHPVRLVLGELLGHHVIRTRLLPLSPSAVGMLAQESGRDAELLHQITGGNPFFVREVLAHPGEHVPETVRDAVLARLARCSATTRELAELVSMSPSRTETWLAESVLGPHQAALDEAGARGLLIGQTESIGFRHELARLAVHGTIPPERVSALHERVLQALASRGSNLARLVHHATLAHNVAAVLEYAPLAAKEAVRLGSHREAAAHLAAALRYRAALPLETRADLFERHALASSLSNQTREAIASATEAIALWQQAGNVQAQVRMLSLLSQEYRAIGDTTRSDESVQSAVTMLEALPPSANLAMAYSARALLAVHRGHDPKTLEFARRALAMARQFGDRAVEAHALCSIGSALLGDDDLSGYDSLEESLALAKAYGLAGDAARAYRSMLFYAVLLHDFERADRLFSEGFAYCDERGIYSHGAYMRAYYAPCELDRGNWTEAARMATELLQGSEGGGVPQRITALATLALALVRVRRGDPGADELLDRALELALPTKEPHRIWQVRAARAERAWLSGDDEGAAREAALGLEYEGGNAEQWMKGGLVCWIARAQSEVRSDVQIAEPYRLTLAGDWRGAAAVWERMGMPYDQALALSDGPDEALLESLAILDKLGANPLADIVRARLRERGVRRIPRGPRDTTRANPAGLTGKEIEVLVLLGQGSNVEIARRLHRSRKTVDHHVSAILGKLGVKSRTEAVAAAFSLGLIGSHDDSEAPPAA